MKGCNPYFLYNYAVELHLRGQYQRSMAFARECTNYWADYDLELLLGLKYSVRYKPKNIYLANAMRQKISTFATYE